MSRIVVTGGCGFLGSHFVRRWLSGKDRPAVTNIDCLTYAGSLANLADVAIDSRHTHMHIDIADAVAIDAALATSSDTIIHFAAETHVDRSLEDAGRFVKTNVLGTQTLLATIVRNYPQPSERPAVIIISTDEVYGPTPKGQVFGTGEPMRPANPYAASKAAADWMALSYARSFDLDLTIVRSVNVYGPYQYPEKFIPLFVSNAHQREPMPLYGHGRHRRSWLYIDDYVEGLMRIVCDPKVRRERRVWHLGSPDELENKDVAAMICRECGADPSLITPVPDRPGHDLRYALDFSRTSQAFGWRPETRFATGLAATIDWFRANPEWVQSRVGWAPSFLHSQKGN